MALFTSRFQAVPTGAEADFNRLCKQVRYPNKLGVKMDFKLSKKNPLHFWQSLAYIIRYEGHCVAVSSFADSLGQNKLYIASNDPMNASQQEEITEVINMFLDLKPENEITVKLLPRHVSYIIKQCRKCGPADDFFAKIDALKGLSKSMEEITHPINASLENVAALLDLIMDNREILRTLRDDTTELTPENIRKMACHLLKMIRVYEAIAFVWKTVKRHQQDGFLTSSVKDKIEFVSLQCHAELAIVKIASECCVSKKLYIGVSTRPCYCCALFLRTIADTKAVDFDIYIVPTDGKLSREWNRIENRFENEFNHVWATTSLEIHLQNKTIDQSSEQCYDSGDEDLPRFTYRREDKLIPM